MRPACTERFQYPAEIIARDDHRSRHRARRIRRGAAPQGTHVLRAEGAKLRKLACLLALAAIAGSTARAAPTSIPAPALCAGVLLRASDGAPVADADTIYGQSVFAVTGDARGGWFIGGEFWRIGTQPRMNLAHLDRKGRLVQSWRPVVDGTVASLARAGRTLYLAGSFRHVDGVARDGVAAVDTVTGRSTAWLPAVRKVDEIVATASAVYLASGQTITPVAPSTGAATGAVLDGGGPFAVTPIRTYLFTGGPYYGGLSAVETSSGAVDAWTSGARGSFSSVTTTGGRIFATGRFQIPSRRHIGLAAWTSDTGKLLWIANSNGYVNSAAVDGNRVYLGGLFQFLGKQKRPRLGAVDVRTGRALAWNPRWNAGLQSTPVAVAASGGRVFVGAAVTSGGNLPACARKP